VGGRMSAARVMIAAVIAITTVPRGRCPAAAAEGEAGSRKTQGAPARPARPQGMNSARPGTDAR
jgi:hypothetical protein